MKYLGVEQLSVCVCYTINKGEKYMIKENFIGFILMRDCNWKTLVSRAEPSIGKHIELKSTLWKTTF